MAKILQVFSLIGMCFFMGLLGFRGYLKSSPLETGYVALDQDFPDPALVKTPEGFYYSYATQTITEKAPIQLINIQVAKSQNLKDWEFIGEALPVKPNWAKTTQHFWAPDVIYRDGLYYLYFSASKDDKTGFCLGAATALRPEGPFTDSGAPLVCGSTFENIDPMAFDDPITEEKLLYWGSAFRPLKVQKLAENRLQFEEGSKPQEILSPSVTDDLSDYRRLLEGAWVIYREGYYYLFVSGDSCCKPAHYATLVARSKSAKGPFEFKNNWKDSVILEADEKFLAPGHNALAEDFSGRTWMLYHAIDRDRPFLKYRIPDDREVRRILIISELHWSDDGWPFLRKLHR